ncbi:MAG: hypothetical protein R3362_09915, partial [Rhodothermales bacterium]|nr:hypothetical protein [Rhodothermales bacterium]
MPLLQFLLVAFLALAAGLGGLVAYFYFRARGREEVEAALSEAEEAELHQRQQDIIRIRQRLEDIHERQTMASETQHARVLQQLETLQDHVEARGHQFQGLRRELRL